MKHPLASHEWLASRVLSLIEDGREVCRLGLVNKTFYSASISDSVWTKRLPPQSIIPRGVLPSLLPLSKRAVYLKLCRSVLYDEGLKRFWLNPASGRECYMISARSLFVVSGSWICRPLPGAMFEEAVSLIGWFFIGAVFREVLRSGKYTLSFRMKLENATGWRDFPMQITIENRLSDDSPLISKVYFNGETIFKRRRCISASPFIQILDSEHGTRVRIDKDHIDHKEDGIDNGDGGADDDGITGDDDGDDDGFGKQRQHNNHEWLEYDMSEFSVEGDHEAQPVDIRISMIEAGNFRTKSGSFFDGIIIRPTIVAEMAELK
ncbi:hypothetical protein KP509_16G068500 [Ceratopteris richardii]|uniref:Uncharacterized protein n=1 Tax=Ceratopteris richardii TaxID=49495 RepID=A0A8T2T177_CERRI|nr:hypothetical protein KP509_16G068500 [Ceratopteris richardii]